MTSCAMVLYLLTALSFVACCILFWLLTMWTSSLSLGCHQWLKVIYAIVIYANIVCIVCYASDGIGWTNFIKLEMLSSRVICWPWFCRITNTWQSYAVCVFHDIHIPLQCQRHGSYFRHCSPWSILEAIHVLHILQCWFHFFVCLICVAIAVHHPCSMMQQLLSCWAP